MLNAADRRFYGGLNVSYRQAWGVEEERSVIVKRVRSCNRATLLLRSRRHVAHAHDVLNVPFLLV